MSTDTVGTEAGLPDSLPNWMQSQRWYAGKGFSPRLQRVGGWMLDEGAVRVQTHFLLDRGNGRTTIYQVPLTGRTEPIPHLDFIEERDGRFWYDAVHDPVYAAVVLRIMLEEQSVGGTHGHRLPAAPAIEITRTSVMGGEQSNSSIICTVADGKGVMLKVFRALHHGENPDVVLQSAIAAHGSSLVPESFGYLSGEWDDPREASGRANGHLAFAQEFLPGVQDAWRVALQSAGAEEDFTTEAHALGNATAEMHQILATALPSSEAKETEVQAILASMRSRLDSALREVPALDGCRESVESIFARAAAAPWPRLQRIHGDYHLGQVLLVEDRGWVILDFEGEPLRPMWERSRPDVPLRDVAGMLRSFDYVAGSVALDGGNAAHWSHTARQAFIEGYIDRSGGDPREHGALLDAFEIDKALYEAVYEARNRPAWLPIPIGAIFRIIDRTTAGQLRRESPVAQRARSR